MPFLVIGNLVNGRISTNDLAFVPEAKAVRLSRYRVRAGDLVFSRVGSVGRASVVEDRHHGWLISGQMLRLRVPQTVMEPRYLNYALRCGPVLDSVALRTVGTTRDSINTAILADTEVPAPPVSAQRAIADFLDRRTAAIDALIEKKQRLIELLAERRAALINLAVTKGLDPNVPMKDSGVPWIGEIPSHWEVKRLKHISPVQTVGVVVQPSQYVAADGDVPFIYGSDIDDERIDVSNARRISRASNRQLRKSMLRTGDLVCVRVGDPGVTAVVPPELDGINCASVMIIRKADSFVSDWLCLALNSATGRHNVRLVEYGAAQKQFNISHAVDFVLPVPPPEEQASIVRGLRGDKEGVEEGTGFRLQTQIDRLREYRQALITAAVTGQIDVTKEATA